MDSAALADPAALLFGDLQKALDAAMTGDVIEIRAGAYTGNFTAYRDVSIRHAGVEVSKLSPELGYDLRAILQASTRTPLEQHALGTSGIFAGTTLSVQGYAPTDTSIQPNGDVTVKLEGLTIRHGAGELGGGVHNLGRLSIDRSTIERNAATGESGDFGRGGGIYNAGDLTVTRSTISGNRAEQYGGALYNASPGAGTPVTATITASTIAYNLAIRLPDQYVVSVRSNGLSPTTCSTSFRATRCGSRPRTARRTRWRCRRWRQGSDVSRPPSRCRGPAWAYPRRSSAPLRPRRPSPAR